MHENFIIKSRIVPPKESSLCYICHKKPCVMAVLIWENAECAKTDGIYVCQDCGRVYKLMGYNSQNTMNWADFILGGKNDN